MEGINDITFSNNCMKMSCDHLKELCLKVNKQKFQFRKNMNALS